MTITPTAASPRTRLPVVGVLRDTFPLRSVVLPWLVARIVVVPVLLAASRGRGALGNGLIPMDGQWFRFIAIDGYDLPYVHGNWSEYPFFPLFPALGRLLMEIGAPDSLALAGVAWVAALVALAGAHRLALRHLDPGTAPWATWFLALAPGSLSMVIGYSDSLFLAGLVWALVLAEDRRWWAAGLVASIATASRPNGVIAVAALLVVVLLARAGWRALVAIGLPSAAFLAGWMAYLHVHVGDATVFWRAKQAWDEMSLAELVADPLLDEMVLAHVAAFGVASLLYLARVRRQPIEWAVISVLVILPPFVLGIVGLARYAVLAFPLQLAVGDVVVRRGRRAAVAYLLVSTVVLARFAHHVVTSLWVP